MGAPKWRVIRMGKQFKDLKERMRTEARARAGEKAESLLREMSSPEPRAGRVAGETPVVNEGEAAAADGADSETAK
jgi:hypothetical protein